jgi:hypothetical protein
MADGQQATTSDEFKQFITGQQAQKTAAPPSAQTPAPTPAAPSAGISDRMSAFKNPPAPPTPPEQKQNFLDTANQYYNKVDPSSPWYSRVGQSLGRTAMMVPNLINAAAASPTEEEQKQGFGDTGAKLGMPRGTQWLGNAAGRAALPFHRLVVAPTENMEKQLSEEEQRDAARGQEHSKAEIYGEHAVASLPVLGPWMVSEGKRAGAGDIAGAATDVGTMIALPKVIKESVPGGRIATAVDEATGGRIPGAAGELGINPPTFPTTTRIASNLANRGGLALERATSPAAIGTGVGAYAGSKIPHVGPGYGAAAGSALASAISEHPLEPMVSLPKLRTLGSENMITPTDAAGYVEAGMVPPEGMKVAMPGKTVSFGEWLKQQPTPKVEVVSPKAEAPVPEAEVNATAEETLGELGRQRLEEARESARQAYNDKWGPGGTGKGAPIKVATPNFTRIEELGSREQPQNVPSAEVNRLAAEQVKGKEVPRLEEVGNKPAEQVPQAEANKLAEGEVKRIESGKPSVSEAQQRQFEHTIGSYAADKLSDSVEGVEAAHKLRSGTYGQYADLANEEGIRKPQALRAKTGDEWTAQDFKRSVEAHGKELNPSKETVIRHLVDKYGPDEIKSRTEGWGKK